MGGLGRVVDPFHVVHLAGDALDECRRRTGQELHHRRGRATDPLNKARRMLHTRSCLLTPRQQHQILNLFASEEHVALEVTWSVYHHQCIPRARHERKQGPDASRNSLSQGRGHLAPSRRSSHWEERSNSDPGTSWPTSTTPTPQAAPPKPSTHPSNTYADPHSD